MHERKAITNDDVCGIDLDERAPRRLQIRKRLMLEDLLVVETDGEIAAIERVDGHAIPAQRVEQHQQELGLQIAAQEDGLEIRKDAVAEQAIVGRGEAASGHGADHVHFIEQASLDTINDYGGVAQLLKDAVRERCRARPATGKCQEEQHFPERPLMERRLRAVAVVWIILLESSVGGAIRAAARERQQQDEVNCVGARHASALPALAPRKRGQSVVNGDHRLIARQVELFQRAIVAALALISSC